MFRFLLATATLVASSALYATPVAFTSCTAGTTTISPCGGDVDNPGGITGPTYSVTAFADASDSSIVPGLRFNSPPLTPIFGQTLSTVAEGFARGSSPPVIQLSVVSHASAGGTFYTSGPHRAGFIEFVVQFDHVKGGDAFASFSDGTHTYSYSLSGGDTPYTYCDINGCGWMAKEPFDVGSTFQVSTGSDASWSLLTSSTRFIGYDDSIVMFNLFESNGVTAVPFSATPEPATWALLLFGLGALCLAGTKRRRTA